MWCAIMVLTKRKLEKDECLKHRLKTKILVSAI
jgi:hypothetical protein